MATRTRMNVYFDPDLLQQVEMLALRRNVSKSAIVEASVASFLSGDAADRMEAAMARRLDRLGRQMDGLDEDLAVLGETLSLFVQFWLTITPPTPGNRPPVQKVWNGSRVSFRPSASASPPGTGSSRNCRAMSILLGTARHRGRSMPIATDPEFSNRPICRRSPPMAACA